MVKTSSFPLSGAVPASWDITLANTLATENILAEMRGGIVDAQTLGSSLVIYGAQEAWLMTADGFDAGVQLSQAAVQQGRDQRQLLRRN
jgi:hypothetical protein